jgi:undecaprenyl pyrophosphate synthase
MIRRALLWLFHLFLNLYRFISCLRPRRAPQPLRVSRRKLPKHLAVIFGDYYGVNRPRMTIRAAELEDTMESVRRLVEWCRIIGVGILSVYDQQGKAYLLAQE